MSEEFQTLNCAESGQYLSLSRNDVALLDPFRADPICDNIDVSIIAQRVISQPIRAAVFFTQSRVNQTDYCRCINCKPMPTEVESVCCQEVRISLALLSDHGCICSHPLVQSILNKEILRIQLLTLWDSTRSSSDVGHKNLRFAAYRSLYFWIFGKRSPSQKFRTCLPSCLVSLVRKTFPDPDLAYVGFISKLPTPKRRRGNDVTRGGRNVNRVNEVDKVKDRGENRSDTNKCINGKGGLKNKEVGYWGDEKSVENEERNAGEEWNKSDKSRIEQEKISEDGEKRTENVIKGGKDVLIERIDRNQGSKMTLENKEVGIMRMRKEEEKVRGEFKSTRSGEII